MARQDLVDTIIRKFSEREIRLTPQRIGVYRYLLENRTHPTVETVYQALKADSPSLSKTTIYNTVDTLTDAGLIRVIRVGEGEARLDGEIIDHGHFFCRACGNVYDFDLDNCHLPQSLPGFRMEGFDVHVTGVGAACSEKD